MSTLIVWVNSNTQSFRLFWDTISEMMCQDLTLICKTYFLVKINDRFIPYFLNSRVCLFDLEFFIKPYHFINHRSRILPFLWSYVINYISLQSITDSRGWKTGAYCSSVRTVLLPGSWMQLTVNSSWSQVNHALKIRYRMWETFLLPRESWMPSSFTPFRWQNPYSTNWFYDCI